MAKNPLKLRRDAPESARTLLRYVRAASPYLGMFSVLFGLAAILCETLGKACETARTFADDKMGADDSAADEPAAPSDGESEAA